MSSPTTPNVREVHRLSLESYRKLERELSSPVMGKDTTPQQTGYLLGIQHVLQKLRDGYTIGT